MVMKDKLTKHNHRSSYFVTKKISIAFLAVMSAAFVIAVPTYISSVNRKGKDAGIAETTPSEISPLIENAEMYQIDLYLK